MKRTARGFLADLTRNVDAWYADRIDYEIFGGRQRATWDAIRAAGGVGPDDRVEVAAILPKEGLSFVTSDPRAVDLKCFEELRHVARHGVGSRRRGKK